MSVQYAASIQCPTTLNTQKYMMRLRQNAHVRGW